MREKIMRCSREMPAPGGDIRRIAGMTRSSADRSPNRTAPGGDVRRIAGMTRISADRNPNRTAPGGAAGKTACLLLILFCLAVFISAAAWAEEAGPVYDYASLLTASEAGSLREQVQELTEKYDMNFVLVTTYDAGGKSATEYADDFYMDHGYYDNGKKGGVIYLIDMDNRELRLETAHDMQYYLTDSRADKVIDAGYDDVAEGHYYDCFTKMLDRTVDFLEAGIPADQYRYDSETGKIERYRSITLWEAMIAIAAAVGAGAAACAGVCHSYRKKHTTYQYPWGKNCRAVSVREEDHLVNQFITHRHIPKDPPPDGGGGGGNVTTTHTSSGGGSFGGSGRSF